MSEPLGESQQPEQGPPPGPPPGYSAPPPPPPSAPPPPPAPPSYGSPPPPSYGQPSTAGYGSAAPYANQLAEWPKRAGAYAIDYLAPFFAVFVVGTILGVISDVLGVIVFLFGYIAAFAFAIYTSYLGGQTGQSIGKQQLGLRLLRESDGQPIGGGLGIGRYFVHIVDAVPCYVGFLWPLWDEKKQTFTDKIIGTVVLDDAKR